MPRHERAMSATGGDVAGGATHHFDIKADPAQPIDSCGPFRGRRHLPRLSNQPVHTERDAGADSLRRVWRGAGSGGRLLRTLRSQNPARTAPRRNRHQGRARLLPDGGGAGDRVHLDLRRPEVDKTNVELKAGLIPAVTQRATSKHLQAWWLTGGGSAGEDIVLTRAYRRYTARPSTSSLLRRLFRCSPSRMNSITDARTSGRSGRPSFFNAPVSSGRSPMARV
jgi:hypothetical protein